MGRVHKFADLAQLILTRPEPVRLVAVDGPGGAGKSTFAARLAAGATAPSTIVHTDDFASWDVPIDWWPKMLSQVIEPLVNGEVGQFRPFNWSTGSHMESQTVPRDPLVIIEGVSAGRSEWSHHLSYSIWIETGRTERLRRGLERDGEDMEGQWKKWMAEEDSFFKSDNPLERADLIVDGSPTITHDPETEFVERETTLTQRP